ncbi:MAG: putative entry exclusion protein TrbK-alt [Pseudomonadota bacterium]
MRRLAKLLLALGLGIALVPVAVAVMIWDERPDDGSEIRAGLVTGSGPAADVPDPSALRRCRDLGQAALDDAACLALWAETRRRFLGGGHGETESIRAPDDAPATEPVDGGRAAEPREGVPDAGRTAPSLAR